MNYSSVINSLQFTNNESKIYLNFWRSNKTIGI